jgi:hypothetical protein
MASKESERILAELQAWCNQKHGRRMEIARMLNVSPQLVSDWMARRRTPTLDDGLKIMAFLKKQRKPPHRPEK